MSDLTSPMMPGQVFSFEDVVSRLLIEVPVDADVVEVCVFYLEQEPAAKIASVLLNGERLTVVYKKSFLNYGPGFVALKWKQRTIPKEDILAYMQDMRRE